jgi:uncharacterized membrane protein YqgA involved in biofilm formation
MFTGIGTLANVAAILAGGLIGLCFKGGLKQQYQDTVIRTLGLSTIFIGAGGALSHMLVVEDGALTTSGPLSMILSLVLGTLAGEFLDFEGKLEHFGQWLKKKARGGEDSRFVEGFVTASLVVCIGAMAIVGALQDALLGDPSTLFTKSILDFMSVMIFTSTYGKGAMFSAIPVGILQGSVTIFAVFLNPLFSAGVIATLSFIGSILIFCVGINLAFGNHFRVANMLPALILGPVLASVIPL